MDNNKTAPNTQAPKTKSKAPAPAPVAPKLAPGTLIALENRTKGMRTYNLVHPSKAHHRKLSFLRGVTNDRGDMSFGRKTLELPDSLTFAAYGTKGSRRTGLPDTILECPEIKRAIERRELKRV